MKITKTRSLRWAVVLAVMFATLTPVSVYAAESGGIGGKPANPRSDNPRTESIFVYELAPGNSISDAVEVFNNNQESKNIIVYATDSIISSGGALACAQAVDPKNDVGNWINVSKNAVSLQPAASQKVDFRVTVPDDAEPGEHNGCIAIQEADAQATSVGNGIALSFRSAIRVAITVPGAIKKELTIREARLASNADKLVGTILLRNNGNVSLDTTITSQLHSLFRTTGQPISGTYPALPQTITELNFEFPKPFWGGLYRIDVIAKYNSNVAESLGEGSASQSTTKSSRYVYVLPATQALIIQLIALTVILGLIWFVIKRYVREPKELRTYKDYKVGKDDDIQTIAIKKKLSWKKLAKINSLKAPYLLKTGQIIKVPTEPSSKKPTVEKNTLDIATADKPKVTKSQKQHKTTKKATKKSVKKTSKTPKKPKKSTKKSAKKEE